jgi:hypothetical protein
MTDTLSAREARRIALAAQGLAAARPSSAPGARQLKALAARLGATQIDSVNVLARAHYLPAFSRLGAYDRTLLEREAWGPRPSLFEYWGHAASLMPSSMQPLFRWRMARMASGEGARSAGERYWATFFREHRAYIAGVLAEIGRRGPVTGGDFAEGPNTPGWWNWSQGKHALEWLFGAGLIATKTRRGFERVYDLTERVLPAAILEAPSPIEAEAQRDLLMIAARAMGVATYDDLRDYFRLRPEETKARVPELVEAGELTPVRVEGWGKAAYLAPGAIIPRRRAAAALLSPFDNLIWRRERVERLFGARIRLEIYTPAHKREHGYYVLPFLLGEAIAARVDLKADRQAGALRVQAVHLEPGSDEANTARALAGELALMAGWLDLPQVAVAKKGDLAAALSGCFDT